MTLYNDLNHQHSTKLVGLDSYINEMINVNNDGKYFWEWSNDILDSYGNVYSFNDVEIRMNSYISE